MHVLLGLFLVAHGLIHLSYLTLKPDDPNYPFSFNQGWFGQFAGGPANVIGAVLVVTAAVGFVLAGLAVIGVPGLVDYWKIFTVIGAIASLATLLLFWHGWLVLGVGINVVLLYGIYALHWSFR